MRRQLTKRNILLLTLLLAVAGGAYAYFSSQGSGTGEATVGTTSEIELSSATVGDLYPGGPGVPVIVNIHNPGAGDQHVDDIRGLVEDNGDCLGEWFAVDDISYDKTLAANASDTADGAVRMLDPGFTGPTGSGAAGGVDQDACQGLTMTINWTTGAGSGSDSFGNTSVSVVDPAGGPVVITHQSPSFSPSGYTLSGVEYDITAPASTTSEPLVLTFTDNDATPPLQVFVDAVPIPDCTGAPGVADPNPCVSARSGQTVTVLSSHASLWNTASVDATPPPDPTIDSSPADPTSATSASFTFSDSESGVTFVCALDSNTFTACSSPKSYTSLSAGSHTFKVKAVDAASNPSAATTFTWTIDLTAPPAPTINSSPADPTNVTSANFSFSDSESGVSFVCALDSDTFTTCNSPKSYTSLSVGSHTFKVKAVDAASNPSASTTFTWTIDLIPPPDPTIDSSPSDPANATSADFSFSDSEANVSFVCALDSNTFTACSSPKSYTSLSVGSHTFKVKALDAATNLSGAATFTWTIDLTAPPAPTLTATPSDPTNATSASFTFSDSESGVTFVCALDSNTFTACSSPKSYTSLSAGSHTFKVKAVDTANNLSSATTFTWTVDTTAPVAAFTATPADPSSSSSAHFEFNSSEPTEVVTFRCKLDVGSYSSCSSPVDLSSLADGSHTFYVLAKDAATNEQATATSYTWTISTAFLLTVSKSGTGTGTVTSSPAGISCGSTCSADFNSGTSVTLTASPSGGSSFAGWSGNCSGTGSCNVTMNATKAVTATFTTPISARTPSSATVNAASVTASKPSGVVNGDVLLAQVIVYDLNNATGTDPVTAPSGWVQLSRTRFRATANGDSSQIIYKKIASSEPASYTWTDTVGSTSWNVHILAFANASNVDVFDVGKKHNGSTSSYPTNSITTTQANDMVVVFAAIRPNGTVAQPSGYSEHYDATDTQFAIQVEASSKIKASAGIVSETVTKDSGSTASGESSATAIVAITP